MKKLVSLLFVTLIIGSALSAQTPIQKDTMQNTKNMKKDNRISPMNNVQQDSMLWYRSIDSIMSPLNNLQRDSMMRTMNTIQRDGLMKYRNKMRQDSLQKNKNNRYSDSLMKQQ